ncbi:MAG TPA: TolC family protein [Nitrococcus sp.]|nr:TolC family protein [Nitrococcus sp.]
MSQGGWQARAVEWTGAACCACLVLQLIGCAGYHALPLDTAPPLASSLQQLRHPGLQLQAPLQVERVALLAVENNPALRAARAKLGVSEAQVLAAGVLPNPSLTGNYTPVLAGPGIIAAWTAGLTQDVAAIVTLSAHRQSAQASARQVNADLLWQEWQVIGKARLLTVDLIQGERMRRLLEQGRDLLAQRYAHERRALVQGNAILTAVTPDLAALDVVRKQIAALERQQQTRRHDLNALLGLAPDVRVPLAGVADVPTLDVAAIRRMLPTLADRRPDLVALQLGYQAQEAQVRAAILGQFPALLIGLTAGRDTSDVRTLGPQVTIDLPIFNHNQGNLATARATRAQLRAEFTARLAAADSQIEASLADLALLRRQIKSVHAQLDEVERVAREASAAFQAGNLNERSYVDLVITRIDKQQELISLEQSLLELQVATATLVGAGMPVIERPPAHKDAAS